METKFVPFDETVLCPNDRGSVFAVAFGERLQQQTASISRLEARQTGAKRTD
jgi:hypothetical protein